MRAAVPRRVAIVGAGPSGLYAAKALLDGADRHDIAITIDIFDRLDVPFGLLRFGVAPDHLAYTRVEETLAATLADDRVTFHPGRQLGHDLDREALRENHDAVIYAVGAPLETRLTAPGADARGCEAGGEIVKWYTGHPDAIDVSLAGVTEAVVVGAGNVALDLARILAAPAGHLAGTKAARLAQAELDAAAIRRVTLLVRRGPQHAAFTTPEFRELAKLDDVALVLHGVSRAELAAIAADAAETKADRRIRNNLKAIAELTVDAAPAAARCVVDLRFFARPVEVKVEAGAVSGVVVERTEFCDGKLVGTGELTDVPAQLVLAAIGYRGIAIPGLPFDPGSATLPTVEGRLLAEPGGAVCVGEYAVGWSKYGATGIIGTAKSDSTATAARVIEDLIGSA